MRGLIPQTLRDELVTASNYASGGSELIQSICTIKQEFYGAGFQLQLKAATESYKDSLAERVADMVTKFEIKKIVEELIYDLVSTDNCILVWKIDGSTLEYVLTVNPPRCDYIHNPGVETLKIELDHATIVNIKAAIVAGNESEAYKAYPKKYIDAVQAGQKWIELSNDDGEYWIVKTHARRFSGLAHPSMRTCFFDIVMRETLIAGDWAVAYYLKRVIEHVKAGEKPPNGLLQNLRALYPTKDQIAQLITAFKAVGQTMRLFTDHTTTIEYPHPPMEIFDPKKFEKVEERILRWGGVIDVMMTGKGEGFSQGHIGVRRFVAQGLKIRGEVADILEQFMMHKSMKAIIKAPAGTTVEATFDEQTLKDPKQILDELTALADRGLMDVETFHERTGQCYELIKSRKLRDIADVGKPNQEALWKPLFEPNQGGLNGDGGDGRPPDGKPKPGPTQRPKPSTS